MILLWLYQNGITEYLVYLNKKAKELKRLINKTKTMIICGTAGRKFPLEG